MPHGVHSTAQTAFRLPEGLLAWLRGQAAKEHPVTMTDILVRALEAERERCAGITTRVTTTPEPAAVSPPPKRARRPRADTVPPVVLREPCPHPKARINKGLCGACGTYVGTNGGQR